MTVYIKSPAKINLHLEILKKRSDGYHELESIVQLVTLYDEIKITETEKKYNCSIIDDLGIRDNIIKNAVDIFRKHSEINCGITSGINRGLKIELKKNIPIGAGLGGGSSNAASVLLGLNKLFRTNLKQSEMFDLAASLGSDVPLFIGNPASIIKGRGEIIEPLKIRNDYKIILVYPGFSISSKDAYKWWDLESNSNKRKQAIVGNLKNMYEQNTIENWQFFNSFGKIIDKKYPVIRKIKKYLRNEGAVYSELTGSGAAVIGIFKENAAIDHVINKLKKQYSTVQLIKTLERKLKPVLE